MVSSTQRWWNQFAHLPSAQSLSSYFKYFVLVKLDDIETILLASISHKIILLAVVNNLRFLALITWSNYQMLTFT